MSKESQQAVGAEIALARLTDGLTDSEQALLRERLWALLARQASRYTQGDSTSLPVEWAEALYESACFTLSYWQRERGLPAQALLRGELDDCLRSGWTLLRERVAQTRALYGEALEAAPPYASRALRDTLRGIAPFFTRYDWRLAAQEIPADIDYPLCLPVPEALPGVAFVGEYLRRLRIEERLLALAGEGPARAVLRRYYGEWEEPLVNLYEPVAACAVGLALAGGDVCALRFAPGEEAALAYRLGGLSDGAGRSLLREAAHRAAETLGLPAGEDRQYLAELAEALWPRARAALSGGSLHGVFACGGASAWG